MNSKLINDISILKEDGSNYKINKEYQALKYRNGVIYNKTYWAIIERYNFAILSPKIELTDMEVKYSIESQTYTLSGEVSMTASKVGTKQEGYAYDDGTEDYTDSGWVDYSENIKAILYIDSSVAADLGTISSLMRRSFTIDLGPSKPDTVTASISCLGLVESTEEDINNNDFQIEFDDTLTSEELTIPALTITAQEEVLEDISIEDIVYELTYDKSEEVGWHEDVIKVQKVTKGGSPLYIDSGSEFIWKRIWAYTMDFTTPPVSLQNMVVEYQDQEYSLRGDFSAEYLVGGYTLQSEYSDDGSTVNISSDQDWDTFDLSEVVLELYIGQTLVDSWPVVSADTISASFDLNLGTSIPESKNLRLVLAGQVISLEEDNEGNLFTFEGGTILSQTINLPNGKVESEPVSSLSISSEESLNRPSDDSPPEANTEVYIEKNIAVTEGWRYMVGVRDIDIKNREYEKESIIITKKLETDKPIKKVMLYSNEFVPKEFVEMGLENRNEWVKYFISINDTDWHRISPMHHNQIGSLEIPPKIYEINSKDLPEVRISSINKGYIEAGYDVRNIRLKIILQRPEGLVNLSPEIEDYALKCITEEAL